MRPKARIAVVIKLSMRVKPLLSDTDFVVYTADDKLELNSEDTMDCTFLLNVSVLTGRHGRVSPHSRSDTCQTIPARSAQLCVPAMC